MEQTHLETTTREQTPEQPAERRRWVEPKLERRQMLPRVTNGFAGSFPP